MGKEDKNEIIYPSPCKNSENIDRMIGYVPQHEHAIKTSACVPPIQHVQRTQVYAAEATVPSHINLWSQAP